MPVFWIVKEVEPGRVQAQAVDENGTVLAAIAKPTLIGTSTTAGNVKLSVTIDAKLEGQIVLGSIG